VLAFALAATAVALGAVAAVGVCLEVLGVVRPGVDDGAAATMALAALSVGAVAAGLALWTRGVRLPEHPAERATSAALSGIVVWLAVSVPVALGGPHGWTAAVVESAATLTGTGASALADVDGTVSRPLLLWRGVAQVLGAVGVLALGGWARGDAGIGASLRAFGALLTVTVAALWSVGLAPLDAAVYGAAAATTGGLGTYDAGASGLGRAAQGVLVGACLLAGFRLSIWRELLRARSARPLWEDDDARAFLGLIALGWLVNVCVGPTAPLVRAVDAASTTGLQRPGDAGSVALLVAVALTAVGGCRGSLAGGIGPGRCALLLRTALWAGVRALSPRRVAPLDPDDVVDAAGTAVAWAALVGGVAALLAASGGAPVGLGLAIGAVVVSNGGADAVGLDASDLVADAPLAAPLLALAMGAGRLGPAVVVGLLARFLGRRP
jgi:trk system potassium uptake protein TrkH